MSTTEQQHLPVRRASSLATQFAIGVGALLIAVSVLLSGLAYVQMRESARAVARIQLAQVADQFVQLLRAGFAGVARSMAARAASPVVTQFLAGKGSRADAEALLRADMSDWQVVGMQIWSADSAPRALLSVGPKPFDESRLPATLERAARSSSPIAGPLAVVRGEIEFPIALRVARNDRVAGYLVMWRRLAATPGTREQLRGFLGATTRIYVGSPADGVWSNLEHVVPGPPRADTAVDLAHYDTRDFGTVFAVARATPSLPFVVVVERSSDTVLAAPHEYLGDAILLALAILGAALAGTALLVRRLTRPLAQLTNAAARVTEGDYSTPTEVQHASNEIGQLARTFEIMVTRVRDAIEARAQADRKLHRAQKLEAVGQLASGIAHDFNNLLTIVIANTEFLLEELPELDTRRADAVAIRSAAQSAARLTRQLLIFTRQDTVQPAVIDVGEAISGITKILGRLLGEDIQVVTTLEASRPFAKIDPGQFEQTIVNLAVNARDAMPNGGRLTIDTSNVEFSETSGPVQSYPPGQYVCITVSDTGVGMSRETQERVFEPFFTTKGPGHGTGLGLATVYGIVESVGGHISVYSELGAGTTFRIYLPAAERGPETRIEAAPAAVTGGTETVLVVEDHPAVRAAIHYVLADKGYHVIEAPDPQVALASVEKHHGQIDLVVTDVVMPEMNGRELADRLMERRPDIKVLFISGYTPDSVLRRGVITAKMNYIEKPFDPDALLRKVREVLDRGAPYRMGRDET